MGNKIIAVYKLTVLDTGHFYYGGSVDVMHRYRCHINSLKKDIHRNKRLQSLFNQYGESTIKLDIVEYCDRENVNTIEQLYIEKDFDNEFCLNFAKDTKAPMKGLRFSEEHKQKIRDLNNRNTYIFYFSDKEKEVFYSYREIGIRFKTRPNVLYKWIRKDYIGKQIRCLKNENVIKIEVIGQDNKIMLPLIRVEKWIKSGAKTRHEYYKQIKKLSLPNGKENCKTEVR